MNAVDEVKAVQGKLIQLMTENHGEAVRTVQRLHRNLGHPSPTSLVEMLESRGASEAVLAVARTFQCHSCLRSISKTQSSGTCILEGDLQVQPERSSSSRCLLAENR